MSEDVVEVQSPIEDSSKLEVYRDPNYVSLYRFENPSIPYDERREGIVSKKEIIGGWYTDNFSDLRTYTVSRMKGKRGGRFVVVRIKKDDLDKYDATLLPQTKDMDIERGNYIIPTDVAGISRIEINCLFMDEWEGKQIPVKDWKIIDEYIQANLTDEVIVNRLSVKN